MSANSHGQDEGFQDGGCVSRSFRHKVINNQALITILNLTLNLKAAFQLRVFHTCVHARKS